MKSSSAVFHAKRRTMASNMHSSQHITKAIMSTIKCSTCPLVQFNNLLALYRSVQSSTIQFNEKYKFTKPSGTQCLKTLNKSFQYTKQTCQNMNIHRYIRTTRPILSFCLSLLVLVYGCLYACSFYRMSCKTKSHPWENIWIEQRHLKINCLHLNNK